VLRRLRHGMGEQDGTKLTGTVEADEVYIGGKPRKGTSARGRGTTRVPVLGMVQRDGNVRFQIMERLTSEQLGQVLAENADLTCRLITDEWSGYRRVGREFAGGHDVVNHSAGEYARGDVHSNTIESVFSLIRRGVMGTFHSVSRKHLANYLHEFSFRWDTRKMNDGERVAQAIRKVEGKRLQYRESVDNPPYKAALPPSLLRPRGPDQADAPFDPIF